MKNQSYRTDRTRIALCSGIVLSAAPVILMLATGILGSAASGRLLMDVLLPAEMCIPVFLGMALTAFAAARRNRLRRLAAALPLAAATALALCVITASASGIASGQRTPEGPLWWLVIALLAVYNLCAATAPILGIVLLRSGRK